MSLLIRMIFFGATGIIAGSLAWPLAETMIFLQAYFPSLLLFSIILGILIGIFMGACFGTSEGIITSSADKIKSGLLMGLPIGAIGGLLGFVIGQAALLLIGTSFFNSTSSFRNFGIPISKAIGWTVFGACLGVVEGIRSRSIDKVKHGLLGGLAGGAVGGLLYELLRIWVPQHFVSRLAGLVILGFLIGLFYGYIENRLSKAILKVLNGRFKGKEFALIQRVSRIGKSPKAEIEIAGYAGIADIHAVIKRIKKSYQLSDAAGSQRGTFLNDKRVSEASLRPNSVIRVGNIQFLFTVKK